MIATCLRCGLKAEVDHAQRRYPRGYLNQCPEIQEKAKAKGIDRPEMEECSSLNAAFDLALYGPRGP